MEKPDLEALKELLRVLVLAILPVLISSLEQNMVDYKAIIIACAIAGMRAVDKWLHEWGKEEADPEMTKGLTRF